VDSGQYIPSNARATEAKKVAPGGGEGSDWLPIVLARCDQYWSSPLHAHGNARVRQKTGSRKAQAEQTEHDTENHMRGQRDDDERGGGADAENGRIRGEQHSQFQPGGEQHCPGALYRTVQRTSDEGQPTKFTTKYSVCLVTIRGAAAPAPVFATPRGEGLRRTSRFVALRRRRRKAF